jgi:hypothetical protein
MDWAWWAWGKETQFQSDIVPQVGLDAENGFWLFSYPNIFQNNGKWILAPFISQSIQE